MRPRTAGRARGLSRASSPPLKRGRHGLTIHRGLYQELELPPATFDASTRSYSWSTSPTQLVSFLGLPGCSGPAGSSPSTSRTTSTRCNSPTRDELQLHDWWVAPPFHLNYFSFRSLERLLERCRFSVVGRDATFPMEWFLLMGENYVIDDELGSSAHRRRMQLEQRLEELGQRRAMHACLAAQSLGREAIVYAKYDG
jgi:hypothetical protein